MSRCVSRKLGIALLSVLAVWPAMAGAQSAEWQCEVRALVAEKRLDAALVRVDRQLQASPDDSEARAWRARLLAWTRRWPEAEMEYRQLLAGYPQDYDSQLGLADVIAWQWRVEESLRLLDGITFPLSHRGEVELRRGRWLRELGQREKARAAFQMALRASPGNAEARAGLESLEPEPRHEVRFTADFDHFAFAQDAQSFTTRWGARWNDRWSTGMAGNFQHRFAQEAGRFLADATFRLTKDSSLTIGGGAANDEGVIPKGEAFFELGRGFRTSTSGFVRGMELGYSQNWYWYRDARVFAISPGATLYFPRDWSWSLRITAARSQFPGLAGEWRPSGSARLSFPIRRDLSGNLFFSVGTENFAQAEQVGRFSARTYGGGLRWLATKRQELSGYAFYQDRSQDRSQIGFGFTYAIRF